MRQLLNDGYTAAKDMVARNRDALNALVDALMDANVLDGDEVRALVERHAARVDLERRALEKAVFL